MSLEDRVNDVIEVIAKDIRQLADSIGLTTSPPPQEQTPPPDNTQQQ